MKIAFDTGHPFKWADGGIRIQYESISNALLKKGVEVEPIKWWDKNQNYDLLQTFYYPNHINRLALEKKVKIVSYINLDGFTSHNKLKLKACKAEIRLTKKFRPNIADRLGWRMNEIASHFIVPCSDEIKYLEKLFKINKKNVSAIMHGVDSQFFAKSWNCKSESLISVGSICRRKNSLFLAKLANELQIPITFVGKFQETNLDYCRKFALESEKKYVNHRQNVCDAEKIELLLDSKAFINLSLGESGCISVLEAFALGMPVILPYLPWSYQPYRNNAFFVNINSFLKAKSDLRYLSGKDLSPLKSYPVKSWDSVALEYLKIYQRTIN